MRARWRGWSASIRATCELPHPRLPCSSCASCPTAAHCCSLTTSPYPTTPPSPSNTPPMPQRPLERSGTVIVSRALRQDGPSPRARSPSVSTTCLLATMRFTSRLQRKTGTGPTRRACCTYGSGNPGGGRGRRASPTCYCSPLRPSSSIRPTSAACVSAVASPPNRPMPAVTAKCCRARSTSSPPSPTRYAHH